MDKKELALKAALYALNELRFAFPDGSYVTKENNKWQEIKWSESIKIMESLMEREESLQEFFKVCDDCLY